MSRDVVETLNKAIAQSLAQRTLRDRFSKAGSTLRQGSPEELRKTLRGLDCDLRKNARDPDQTPVASASGLFRSDSTNETGRMSLFTATT